MAKTKPNKASDSANSNEWWHSSQVPRDDFPPAWEPKTSGPSTAFYKDPILKKTATPRKEREKHERKKDEQRRAQQKEYWERKRAAGTAQEKPVRPRALFESEEYKLWAVECLLFFAAADGSGDVVAKSFPELVHEDCTKLKCISGNTLGVCVHDVERVLAGSPAYDEAWLRKERLRWHPDRFAGRAEVQVNAQELFQMIQQLVDRFVEARESCHYQ